MPYIEWHHSIRHHHKTDHLAELLKIEPYAALGIRGALYAWAVDERPGGIIERELLATAARFPRNKRATLEAALLESKLIDSVDEKTVQIHDWQDFTRGYRKSKADIERRRGSATVAQQTRDKSATVAVSGSDLNGTERSSEAPTAVFGKPPLAPKKDGGRSGNGHIRGLMPKSKRQLDCTVCLGVGSIIQIQDNERHGKIEVSVPCSACQEVKA